ncbi:MAG: hypothetical protein Q8K78_17830 [Planctomycetaceae bacterium]|nr:hypothetical protein [Planctomycetaceae bacterium]
MDALTPAWPLRVYPQPKTSDLSVPGWERLKGAELRRRMLHMLPGLFPFVLWAIPHPDPWGPYLFTAVIGVTTMVVIHGLRQFAAFARPGEENGRSSILGYAVPLLASLFVSRGREELCLLTLAILAFGDGSATVGGLLFGGRPLPWNSGKTVTGLLCFWAAGGILGTVVYWGESRPGVSWAMAAAVAGVTVFLAGILESLPSRINDNLRVGFASIAIGTVMHFALVG